MRSAGRMRGTWLAGDEERREEERKKERRDRVRKRVEKFHLKQNLFHFSLEGSLYHMITNLNLKYNFIMTI